MAGKEGLNPQYTAEQIRELQASRTVAIAEAIEGGARLHVTGAQIEKARQEMRQEIGLQKARQKIADYLKGGNPVRQQVVDDVIEMQWDNAFVYAPELTTAARAYFWHLKEEEWSKRDQQRYQIKGYYIEKIKFDYEVGRNYWEALRPIVSDPVKRHLKFSRDLKEIRQENEEKTQQPQTSAQK